MTGLATQKNEKWFIWGMALLQGIALLLIWLWVDRLNKPRQYFDVILPLYVLAISLPLSLMLLAHQPRQLTFRLTAAFSLLAAFSAMYFGDVIYVSGLPSYSDQGRIVQFVFCMIAAWFIGITFIEHYCQYQHWFNRYQSLYDFSWRNAVKLITASIFTGLFWAALLLLAGLFNVLGIKFFDDVISSVYFIYPATAVAAGVGLSLYAAKQEALSEFKRAILQVLGWLLPLVSLILIAFMVTLPFKGLGLLWGTGYATSLMLGLLALMVFLLNTAFQDGQQTQYPAWLLKLSNIAVLTMPIYAALSVYAVFLRVVQYGWTDDRVWAASITFIAVCYSVGYGWAAVRSLKSTDAWMAGIKSVNVLTAVVIVGLVGLLHSPVLDPMRIGVQSQLARLYEGKVQDNVAYLRFNGGKYGDAALREMLKESTHPQAETFKQLAKSVLEQGYYSEYSPNTVDTSSIKTVEAMQTLLSVYPKGASIERDFYDVLISEHLKGEVYLYCAHEPTAQTQQSQGCQLLSIDLNQDGQPEVVLLNDYDYRVYTKDSKGWHYLATYYLECCNVKESMEQQHAAVIKALEADKAKAIVPTWQDLKIGDKTYHLRLN